MQEFIRVRAATEADLDDVADMVRQFVAGHPAENHPRSRERLREAFFGDAPVARLVLACRGERVVGMGQWTLIYDMFWGAYGGEAGWLFVRPEARGLGISPAIVAEICRQVRDAGGEFLHGGSGTEEIAGLYESVAMGWPERTCYLSAAAFDAFADLAGLRPRQIVSRLPPPELNRVAVGAER